MLCRGALTLPTGRTLKIDNAEREILVSVYGLTTGSGIVGALVRAKGRGVDVRLIADKTTPCEGASGARTGAGGRASTPRIRVSDGALTPGAYIHTETLDKVGKLAVMWLPLTTPPEPRSLFVRSRPPRAKTLRDVACAIAAGPSRSNLRSY